MSSNAPYFIVSTESGEESQCQAVQDRHRGHGSCQAQAQVNVFALSIY